MVESHMLPIVITCYFCSNLCGKHLHLFTFLNWTTLLPSAGFCPPNWICFASLCFSSGRNTKIHWLSDSNATFKFWLDLWHNQITLLSTQVNIIKQQYTNSIHLWYFFKFNCVFELYGWWTQMIRHIFLLTKTEGHHIILKSAGLYLHWTWTSILDFHWITLIYFVILVSLWFTFS